jgi:hypothetical protein
LGSFETPLAVVVSAGQESNDYQSFFRYLLYAKELVNLGFSREERLPISQLAKDAAYGPDVNLLAIVVAQQQLWSSVPSSGYIIGKSSRVLVVENSCKTKVTDSELVCLTLDH